MSDKIWNWIEVRFRYDLQSYDAYKQNDSSFLDDARARESYETTTIHNGKQYSFSKMRADVNFQVSYNYFSSFVQLKSLKNWLEAITEFGEIYK